MSFIKEYAQKLVTAEEAVKVVKSHDWVDYGWTTGTPVALDAALAARADELEDVKIRGGILLREPEIFKVNNVADSFYMEFLGIWVVWRERQSVKDLHTILH